MKDNQVTTASAEPRIFLLSPTLHCVSMTALVFLRSSFGYAFLRPKSFFFAASWAFALYAIYAWIDRGAWLERRALLWYGVATVALYWFHFSVTISREWRGVARHDNNSGTPHIKLFVLMFGETTSIGIDRHSRLLVEPATIVCIAIVFYFIVGERHLSAWLLLTGVCLWTKEMLNQWFQLRRQKRQKDITDDAMEAFSADSNAEGCVTLPKTTSRKHKINRRRIN